MITCKNYLDGGFATCQGEKDDSTFFMMGCGSCTLYIEHCKRLPKPNDNDDTRPALGLMPMKLHRQSRLIDILEASLRYIHKGEQIPDEWIDELDTINGRIF